MLKSLNTAATGMGAQSRQIEIISNNLANAETTAFKRSRADFQDLLYQNVKEPGAATSDTTNAPVGVQVGLGADVVATTREHQQGSPRPTDRDLDVMIFGGGFLSFQKPDGNVFFSRDGVLHMDGEGRLTTAQGYLLLPEITIPQNTKKVGIAPDGNVVAYNTANEAENVGQIQLTTFTNPSGLAAIGENLYAVSPASGEPQPGNPGDEGFGMIRQGFLEASNVTPVKEMTSLIRAQRMYELNSKVISTTDDMLQTLGQLK